MLEYKCASCGERMHVMMQDGVLMYMVCTNDQCDECTEIKGESECIKITKEEG